jgi:PPOX class probable F420-dependent enzyme
LSERDPIDPAARELLARSRRSFLFTLRADGSPTAHPMTAQFEGSKLAFSTYRKSIKTRNAQRDPRTCTLVLEAYPGPGRTLVYRGAAEIVEGDAAVSMLDTAKRSHSATAPSLAQRSIDRLAEGKRIVLAIDPEEVLQLELEGN